MAAHQVPPSLGFSRQEHWSGLPFPSPMHESEKWKGSRSVVSDSSQPHGLRPTRLLRPWDFLGKSTGVGCHRLLCGKVLFILKNPTEILPSLKQSCWDSSYSELPSHFINITLWWWTSCIIALATFVFSPHYNSLKACFCLVKFCLPVPSPAVARYVLKKCLLKFHEQRLSSPGMKAWDCKNSWGHLKKNYWNFLSYDDWWLKWNY